MRRGSTPPSSRGKRAVLLSESKRGEKGQGHKQLLGKEEENGEPFSAASQVQVLSASLEEERKGGGGL